MSTDIRFLIHIDGQALLVEKGLTVLQAARQNGIEIPTLCDFPGLPSHGSCRMCIVEIQGRPNTPTACTTPVEAGMVIATHSPKVQVLRAELLQMLLAEHPAGCLYCPEKDRCDECMVTLRKAGVTTGCGSCPKDTQCALQALAEKYGVMKPSYPIRYRMLPVEKHNPFFDRDNNLCILCGRCIRVCEDLHFANTLTYSSRGTQVVVSTPFDRAHIDTSCTFCGSCVEVCPTGALTEKTRKWDGLPERETDTTCPFCALGCELTLLSKQERVMGSLPNHRAGTEVLCVKGRFGVTELVNPVTRLKQPQYMTGGIWQPTDWKEAVQIAAQKLSACPPERFELRVSSDCTLEDLYVAAQFTRTVMKSSNICIPGLTRFGSAVPVLTRLLQQPASLDVMAETPAILCLGLEDPYAHSVIAVHLKRAKKRGVRIIDLNVDSQSGPSLSWRDYVDVRLGAQPGEEKDLLLDLLDALDYDDVFLQEAAGAIAQAALLLRQPGAPLILIGPAFLSHPRNELLLETVERLARHLGAYVILLPEQRNLSGALRLGLHNTMQPLPGRMERDVVYLIGETPSKDIDGRAFVLSHSLSVPIGGLAQGAPSQLLLPVTAFSEEHGTFIDYAGRVQTIRPAVTAPGEARPSWMILSQIARQMGAPGFDYQGVENIWQAAQADFPGFPFKFRPAWANMDGIYTSLPDEPCNKPTYMGLPLTERVAGLRSLYPTGPNGRRNG